ncbi:MAG TPA: nitroreductase/quinone reductase family protein, partial [Chloroflexota bacterium]|nr:nitroreductase/quinone reductase family protein [Chloroflexota bacterium]
MRTMMKVMGSLHRLLYRLSNGKLGANMGKMSVLLLTTTGRKTGQPRTWPISFQVDGDNLIMVASAGGQPQHPAWYLNLQAHPNVT